MNGRWHRIVLSLLYGITFAGIAFGAAGCSRDMAEQPSFQPQEAPRLHSPEGSIPQKSRAVLTSPPESTPETVGRGAALFEINCSHCHGKVGLGDGPAGSHLVLQPFNLHAPQTQQRPAKEIFDIITHGRVVMPSFNGVLSVEERWDLAYFVKSFGKQNGSQKTEVRGQKKAETQG